MFNRLEDFRNSWKEETQDTLKVLTALSDQALDQAVAPDYRDLRRLGWHLVESIGLARQIGLPVEGPACNERGLLLGPLPQQAEAVVTAYTRSAESLLKSLEAWSDSDLQKVEVMFGHLHWTKGQTLFAIIAHQIHHRGQMTVLMRQAGLRVPEFYGPTREGWAALGMPVPAV
jgi:uncharacterized damage-inducible protein DinB